MDDEASLCDIFAKWLTAVGCSKVLTANNGYAALEIMKTATVDLLISDVRMPVMDGVALVRALGQLGKSLPSVIFVSGFGDMDRREMYALGVEAFLAKPFDREELLLVIEHALAARSALWLTPMLIAPQQRMVIKIEEENAGGKGSIQLGRGGFSTRYDLPLRLSSVAFQCSFLGKKFELSGQGYVRWRSESAGTVGVEFAFLDEPNRPMILAEMAQNASHSFIPEF